MMGFFSHEKPLLAAVFRGASRQKAPAKGLIRRPFSPKAGAMRRPLAGLFAN
jgi:hypothetical protein